jgi:hypothetical protein
MPKLAARYAVLTPKKAKTTPNRTKKAHKKQPNNRTM